jgi:hypothetical protein
MLLSEVGSLASPGFTIRSLSVTHEQVRTLKTMEVHFAPELQAEIDQLVVETGLAPDKLVEDAMAGYVAELVETREMLNRRYDDLKTGKVTPISRDEVIAHFREKSAAARRKPPAS